MVSAIQIEDLTQNPAPALTDQSAIDNAAGLTYKTSEAQRMALNSPHPTVVGATTVALVGTYDNGPGDDGIDATFTVTATGVLVIDTLQVTNGSEWLFKNQGGGTGNPFENGFWVCTTAGAIGVQPVFTRRADFNSADTVTQGSFTLVLGGTQAGTIWYESNVGPFVIGTTPITFAKAYAQAALLNAANTFTKAQSVTPVAVTSANNLTPTDASLSNIFTTTLTENTTISNPTNLISGTYYAWVITQAAGSPFTVSLGVTFKPMGPAFNMTATLSAKSVLTALYDGTDLLYTFAQA